MAVGLGSWHRGAQAEGFSLCCTGAALMGLSDLRGHIWAWAMFFEGHLVLVRSSEPCSYALLSMCRVCINNGIHQHLQSQRMQRFPQCLAILGLVRWLPLLILKLPFKLWGFFCAAGQENLCAGPSIISLIIGHHVGMGFQLLLGLHFSCHFLCGFSILQGAEVVFSDFSSSSEGIALYVDVHLVNT